MKTLSNHRISLLSILVSEKSLFRCHVSQTFIRKHQKSFLVLLKKLLETPQLTFYRCTSDQITIIKRQLQGQYVFLVTSRSSVAAHAAARYRVSSIKIERSASLALFVVINQSQDRSSKKGLLTILSQKNR